MNDEQAMRLALAEARAAVEAGEVPVGAVVLKDGQVVGTGRNSPIGLCDPAAHAEILALRAAARALGNYRLDGCELFVTLEPCAMCVGAMLHARLARVVFGAEDPRSGAAGSVVDLFSQAQLNHRTKCVGGVLAAESARQLQMFFEGRREAQAIAARQNHPLRDDALRTAAARFADLPASAWMPRYLSDLPTLEGLRLHYLDEGSIEAPVTFVCLHGHAAWCDTWRRTLPVLLSAGFRVIAPDLIGFGKSDKPKKEAFHTFDRHRQILLEFIRQLELQNLVLVVQGLDWHPGFALPQAEPSRFRGLLAIEPVLAGVQSLSNLAPYPDDGHRAAPRRFATLASEEAAEVLHFWSGEWQGQTMFCPASAQVPLTGRPALARICEALAHPAPKPAFVDPPEPAIAEAAVRYFQQ